VDGDDHDIPGPLRRPRPADDVIGGRAGQIGQEIDAGPARAAAQPARIPLEPVPAGEDHHAAATRHRDGRRPPGLTGVTPGAHRPQPGTGHRVQGVLQPWLGRFHVAPHGHDADAPAGLAKLTRLPAGHWTGERAASDILTLARKGRAFASLDSLIARQGGQHVLYGSALALAAALQARSRHAGTPLIDLARTVIR